MFTAKLFTTPKVQKQPKCPKTIEWIKMCYKYTMKCYSVIKEDKMMPFVTKWMELEGMVLN